MAIVTVAKAKRLLGISGSAQNSRITALIPVVEADYVSIRGAAFDVDADSGATIYPDTAEWTAAKMINWILNGPQPGIDQESVNEYSVKVQTDRLAGYPRDVVGSIEALGIYQ